MNNQTWDEAAAPVADDDEHKEDEEEDEELRKLLVPNASDLPPFPPSAVHSSFVAYYALDFMKPAHDHFIYRHPNGLCVVGLAPGHVALRDEGGVKGVDFNVGKSDRSAIKVTGKRKKNAQHFEANTVLCKVSTSIDTYVVRCCVKGSLLEVNEKLVKQPDLLNTAADREGYIAIIMPKPADWLKVKATFLSQEEYNNLRAESLGDFESGGDVISVKPSDIEKPNLESRKD